MNTNRNSMEGKVILITGGARGVGAASAQLLASRGEQLAVNYLSNAGAAEAVVQKIQAAGGEALAVQADVREEGDVARMVHTVADTYGRIDGLVSNTSMRFVRKPVVELTWAEFAQKLNDELKAAFLMTQAVAPLMVRQGSGRIVYVGSNNDKATTLPGASAHGTAKAGLVMFCRYVASELGAAGVTANVVSLGFVATEATANIPEMAQRIASLTPLGRTGQPEDAAGAIALFLSDDSGFITGTRVTVNGGLDMN